MKRFNLIELILVITTVIGLAAVLLPLLFRSLREAQSMTCSKNLSQLGTMVTTYANQSDGYLPGYEWGWVQRVGKAGGQRVNVNSLPEGPFACPSQKPVSFDSKIPPVKWWRGSNYGINQHMASALRLPNKDLLGHWTRANIKKIRKPSGKALLGDATGGNVFGKANRDPVIAGISLKARSHVSSLPPTPTIGFPYMRHKDGKVNILFLDQQVKGLSTWPEFTLGRATPGFEFWHAEHWYADQGLPTQKKTAKGKNGVKRPK